MRLFIKLFTLTQKCLEVDAFNFKYKHCKQLSFMFGKKSLLEEILPNLVLFLKHVDRIPDVNMRLVSKYPMRISLVGDLQ